MTEQTITIHDAHKINEKSGKFIIGIKDGVAMVRYPNNENYRTVAAAEGFDIITVNEEQANLLWKKTISMSVQIIDLKKNERKA